MVTKVGHSAIEPSVLVCVDDSKLATRRQPGTEKGLQSACLFLDVVAAKEKPSHAVSVHGFGPAYSGTEMLGGGWVPVTDLAGPRGCITDPLPRRASKPPYGGKADATESRWLSEHAQASALQRCREMARTHPRVRAGTHENFSCERSSLPPELSELLRPPSIPPAGPSLRFSSCASAFRFLLRLRYAKKIKAAMAAAPTTPPTTPPAIAPVLEPPPPLPSPLCIPFPPPLPPPFDPPPLSDEPDVSGSSAPVPPVVEPDPDEEKPVPIPPAT